MLKALDTHAQLDFPQFDSDRAQLIDSLSQAGVGVINIATDVESLDRIDELTRKNPLIWGTVGLHPTEVDSQTLINLPDFLNRCKNIVENNSKIVAVGEVGLDYHHDSSTETAKIQQAALRQFLNFAQELKLPVVFHCRSAYGDLITLLGEYVELNGVIHCFGGTVSQAEALLKMGYHISFAGNITYKSSDELREVAGSVPLERLLLETDCPFLAPQSRRGTRNDPTGIFEIAETLAAVHNVEADEIVAKTLANGQKLFQINE